MGKIDISTKSQSLREVFRVNFNLSQTSVVCLGLVSAVLSLQYQPLQCTSQYPHEHNKYLKTASYGKTGIVFFSSRVQSVMIERQVMVPGFVT